MGPVEGTTHLERVADEPVDEHAESKAVAATTPLILENLRNRQQRLNAQSHVPLQRDVRGPRANEHLQYRQDSQVVRQELPVATTSAPLPEAKGSFTRRFVIAGERLRRLRQGGSVQEGDVQKVDLDADHQEGLKEEREIIAGSKPVENSVEDQFDECCERERKAVRQVERSALFYGHSTHLRIEATSMIKGMSREKPAEERDLAIE